jgi:hypothetical protein
MCPTSRAVAVGAARPHTWPHVSALVKRRAAWFASRAPLDSRPPRSPAGSSSTVVRVTEREPYPGPGVAPIATGIASSRRNDGTRQVAGRLLKSQWSSMARKLRTDLVDWRALTSDPQDHVLPYRSQARAATAAAPTRARRRDDRARPRQAQPAAHGGHRGLRSKLREVAQPCRASASEAWQSDCAASCLAG